MRQRALAPGSTNALRDPEARQTWGTCGCKGQDLQEIDQKVGQAASHITFLDLSQDFAKNEEKRRPTNDFGVQKG